VRTVITHTKGASWDAVKAPTSTTKGKIIDCDSGDGCQLNLEIYSSAGAHAPVYSSESATGVVIATGNLGPTLTENDIGKNLYISRDGGLSWKSVKEGNYIYDIGDHGALILAAKINQATTQVEFTWDFGQTWETMQISDEEIYIRNIITEPKSTSQHFLVYGESMKEHPSEGSSKKKKEEESDDDVETKKELVQIKAGALIYLDFSQLHEPQCKGADYAGTPQSDFELWTPYDGRHGDNKRFLGQ